MLSDKKCARIKAPSFFTVVALMLLVAGAFTVFAAAVAFQGCTSARKEPVAISVSNWVGYTPLLYIHEKGWMADRVRFVAVSSLLESLKLFQAGLTDGFAGTQYEYQHSLMVSGSIVPIILIDRSNGADAILGNVTIEKLREATEKVPVYMETQSVNSLFFLSFKAQYGLPDGLFAPTNMEQGAIATLTPGTNPRLVVTYEPYVSELLRKGFLTLASTKDVEFLVLDAIFLEQKALNERKDAFRELVGYMKRARDALASDPREFYDTVNPYLGNQSYDEFIASLRGIEWLLDGANDELRPILQKNGIPMDWILQ